MQKLMIAALVLAVMKAGGQEFTTEYPVADTHFSTFGGSAYFTLNPGH